MKFLRILLGVSLSAILFAIAGAAGLASAATGGGASCPSVGTLGNFVAASNVSASFSNSGKTTTYTFISLMDENPLGGVPGLVGYCVYPSPAAQPTTIVVKAKGANGALWKSTTGSSNFAFVRPNGDKSNIPLDGKTTVMGTATWSTLPTDQTILLHINDPAICSSLYGSTSPYTCYVKPSEALACDQGDTTVAYNAMPFGVVHCSKGTVAFEANAINEFGDEVALAGTARKITSLNVEFNSFGCGDSGHWFNSISDKCVTTPGETFTVPGGITATIYDPSDLTTPLGAATIDPNIPFRPSADTTGNCTGADAGKWFDSLLDGGVGGCVNSLSTVLTFTFPGITIPNNVVWTVQFDTTHSGYTPIGESTTCFTTNSNNPGCGYDSLNVGVQSYIGAPYAGTDVDEAIAFYSLWSPGYPPPFGSGTLQLLQSQTGFTGFRPLGEIITTP